ncbi:MAG: hypothetical protein JEZ09_03655 [Salinivirgaceae bacterium]|nr:hypothetical protein [Salinivirgaceae bacterium]
MEKLRFAFAICKNNLISEDTFGKAPKYHIYDYCFVQKQFFFFAEVSNPSIGKLTKGKKLNAIIGFFKQHSIDVLVAKTYEKLLNAENKFVIPILINTSTPQDACLVLKRHIKWLYDEKNLNKKEYMLFKIEKGIVKYKLEDNERYTVN